MDIQRHLNCEPVIARPPSKLYEFQKTVRRHKFGFGAAAALVVVLATGVFVSAREAIHARQAEHEQSQLRQQAQQAAGLAEAQRARAETLAEENRVTLYAARIKIAEETLKDGDARNALSILNELIPQEGQSDLRSFDWFYLWKQCHNEKFGLSGQAYNVYCVAFSPDGRMVATGGNDRLVHLSGAADGSEFSALSGHNGPIRFVP
jgi:hypothetical protein